jgi:hypothetical protein
MEQTIDKTMVTKAIISKIQDENMPEKIKAIHLKDYDTPDKISVKGKNIGYTPDIEAFFKKEINVYEIELDKKMPVEKWRLLSLYAKKNNGNFYLVIPDYLRGPVKDEISKNDISARIIYFETN